MTAAMFNESSYWWNIERLASLPVTVTNEIVTGTVIVDGVSYPAEPIAGGAGYEVF